MKQIIFSLTLLFAMALGFSSCRKELIDRCNDSSTVIENVKRFVYDSQGDIILGKTDDFKHNEWIIGVKGSTVPLEVFSELTGMEASLSQNYSHIYRSNDGTCIISIKGSLTADEEFEYAELTVIIPGMEEIRTIHFVSEEYNLHISGSRNDSGTPSSGVPVIMDK